MPKVCSSVVFTSRLTIRLHTDRIELVGWE